MEIDFQYARQYLAAIGQDADFADLPDEVLYALYPNICKYGPNGDNVALMGEALATLDKLEEEPLEDVYMQALQLIAPKEYLHDSVGVFPGLRAQIASLGRDVDFLPIEFPFQVLSYVALSGMTSLPEAVVFSEAQNVLHYQLCELVPTDPQVYNFEARLGKVISGELR